ncbi:hypothetical protein [Cohnella thermotolerans]|uniref:hypothetical protein n=1 Tax=Cohnella thermotolerans TaxID=329858 RepID=UPI0004798402|nr:hypothetical protein [Cohnella thermotolerans]
MRTRIFMKVTRPLDELAERPVTTICTRGIAETGLHPMALYEMYRLAIQRWKYNSNDCFMSIQPNGIEAIITDGNKTIGKALISNYPGLKQKVYVIVDDYADKGLVQGLVKVRLMRGPT